MTLNNLKKAWMCLTVLFLCGLSTAHAKPENILSIDNNEPLAQSLIKNPFNPKIPAEKKITPLSPVQKKETPAPKEQSSEGSSNADEKRSTTPPKFLITGLIWNTNRPQAIVNNRVVNIGDSVSDATIIAINKTGIDIMFQGTNLTIKP